MRERERKRERERGRGRTRPGATNGSHPKSEQTRPIIIMVCITTRGTCRQSSRPQGHSKLGANLSPSVCRLSLYRPAQDARYSVLSTILYVSCPQRLPPLFPLPTFPSRQVASGGESMGVEIAPGRLPPPPSSPLRPHDHGSIQRREGEPCMIQCVC